MRWRRNGKWKGHWVYVCVFLDQGLPGRLVGSLVPLIGVLTCWDPPIIGTTHLYLGMSRFRRTRVLETVPLTLV